MAATFLITGASGLIGFRILLTALASGHNVRYTVRSEEKAKVVSENPAVKKLGAGDRLVPLVIPDLAVDGALDSAVQGVTHIIHVGSPVPVPTFDPVTQIYEPTVRMSAGILQSALKSPSVRRVVITSSIVANLNPSPEASAAVASASTRVPPPSPVPKTFDNVMEAYVVGKLVEMRDTDNFAKDQAKSPHFTISHVVPGYVFGRNELALDTGMMQTQNSSNNFLMVGLLGGELPFPIHGGFAHIDDVAEIHVRVALDEAYAGKDVGIATKVDYATIFDQIKDKYPEAVKSGIFKKGVVPTLPVEYDSSDAKGILGELKSFEAAVSDVAAQYLELLEKK
ncbi:hypothetical protein KVR01_011100 [Diaporthe batatas]|uniref:uncharacterized protein n=1 Tax=Diaporthe batatas TaxID=748121 RepID=UPI001D051C69|nr:uncharacterized protein KVR01_011100 [Diaporthe batatas]KAG8159439.1 hypothetical protein KVR01_011100 [Diaporthe batatas]